jgi:D-alanyl-D-alanine carboxypeptidase
MNTIKKFGEDRKKIVKLRKRLKLIPCLVLVLLVSTFVLILVNNKTEAPSTKLNDEKTQNPDLKDKAEVKNEETVLDIKTAASQYVLVNKAHPLNPIDYKPSDLVSSVVATSSSDTADERSIREIIKTDVVKMFDDAKVANLDLIMNSGFRSSKLQSFYYNNYVKNSGEAAANKFSAKPGYSEHQTGLAFDVSYANRKCYLEICFAETEAGKWLAEHAHEYGFILRYPNGKDSVTGYQFEPWHFRYVGKEVARIIYEKQTTYEEYLADLGLITL